MFYGHEIAEAGKSRKFEHPVHDQLNIIPTVDLCNTLSPQSSSDPLTFPANLPSFCPNFPNLNPPPPANPIHRHPPPFQSPLPPSHPSPPKTLPSPPPIQTPVIFPPPAAPSPPKSGTARASRWCIAKPAVPADVIQAALDYACGYGADCSSIQPGGACYRPDTVLSHASYAFNSYWQATKAAGGTCDFGGIAILITKDPSKCSLFMWYSY